MDDEDQTIRLIAIGDWRLEWRYVLAMGRERTCRFYSHGKIKFEVWPMGSKFGFPLCSGVFAISMLLSF